MELSTSQDVHNVSDIVQQYLHDAESSPSGLEERSHLAQLCSECILLFQVILKTLTSNSDASSKEMKTMSISLKRSYGRLKIWADENGVMEGTLDATLAASPNLRRDILKYIVSISQTLSERLISFLDINLDAAGLEAISALRSLATAVTEGDSDSSSDSGFSDSSSYSVRGILEDLRVDTTCLQDLEPLLCSPILRIDPEPTAYLDTTRMTWNPHQPYSDKVSARFPMAADDLVVRLGKANYERYLRCQKQKAANELRDTPADQAILTLPDSASSKFHDSGIGSSLPTTASAYAETVMSYGMGEGRRVRVPPLPAGAKEGLPFACVACGNWVKITTNSAWKQHVYKDLEPWVCLETDCVFASDTFPTRNDWTTHLALDHGMDPEWSVTVCPLCRIEIGPGKVSITRHMVEHLEEISLSALPADCEFEEESDGDETDRGDDNDRYICQICNKAFSRPSSLRIHSYSHTGDKPFKCPHAGCGKAFSVRSNMKRHERGLHFSIDPAAHNQESEGVTTRPEVLEDQVTLETESLSTTTGERKTSTLDILQDKDGVKVPQSRREPVPREVIGRNGPLSEEAVQYFRQNMDRLYADTSSKHDQDWIGTGPAANDLELGSPIPDGEPFYLEGDEYDHGIEKGSRPRTAAGFVDNSKQNIGGGVLRNSETRRASAQPAQQQQLHLQPPQQDFVLFDTLKRRVPNRPDSQYSAIESASLNIPQHQQSSSHVLQDLRSERAAQILSTYGKDLKFENAETPSSYWSVAEMNHFPELLSRFGTDWEGIASHMTTKTATMVRDFYNKQTGTEKPEWRRIAFAADIEPQGEKMLHVPSMTDLHHRQLQETKQQMTAAETHTQVPTALEAAKPQHSSQSHTRPNSSVTQQGSPVITNAMSGGNKSKYIIKSLTPYFPNSMGRATTPTAVETGSSNISTSSPPVPNFNSQQQQLPSQIQAEITEIENKIRSKYPKMSQQQAHGQALHVMQQRLMQNQVAQNNIAQRATSTVAGSPQQEQGMVNGMPAVASPHQYSQMLRQHQRQQAAQAQAATHSPHPDQPRGEPNLSTYEATMTTAVKRACDACHRRKVKCDGTNPCRNCYTAQLGCTYHAIPEKKVPKGSRAEVISELRRFNANRTNNEVTANIPQVSNPTTEAQWLAEQQVQNMARVDEQNMNTARLRYMSPQNAQLLAQARFIQQQKNIMRANMESAQQPGTPIRQQRVTQGNLGLPAGEQMHQGQKIVNMGRQQSHPEGASDGGLEEVGDRDLIGGGDSVAELKRAKAAMQQKKTERELRREAEARAREEERLERLREWREREEEKLRGLKELARARFG